MTLVARHAALTDIGLHRKTNEDTRVAEPPLFAVCDGMGGARAGEVASGLAAATLVREAAAGATLLEAAEAANAAVYRRANDDLELRGMGTTLTAFRLEGDVAHFAHIGDSRAYLLRAGRLEQLSDDHSLVGEMVREGRLTAEEAAVHPHRSVLSRALGTEPTARIDEFEVDLLAGDVLLLCSDGLSGPVADEAIETLLGHSEPEEAGRALIAEARRHGGPDNITAVVVRLEESEGHGDTPVAEGPEEVTAVQPPVPAAPGREGVRESAGEAAEPSGGPARAARPSAASRRRLIAVVVILALLVGVALSGALALSLCYFVGVEGSELVVYSGLPLSVGPVDLHVVYRRSAVAYDELTPAQRSLVDRHDVRGRAGAMRLATALGMWP